ncbi:MAG: RNA polymerase subunit sigma-70 [Planctomycetaceae bacterium]|nr:RNA polymerase subunit sigma-70 [Planctomycetaceae bacterium]
MALSEFDRELIDRCLSRAPEAWTEFVDRYIGLVIHTINHTAQTRSLQVTEQDVEDYTAEVFLQIVSNDLAVLRRFKGNSSLATYLAVIVRRIVVREFVQRRHPRTTETGSSSESEESEASQVLAFRLSLDHPEAVADKQPTADQLLTNQEIVAQLLSVLDGNEREVVRLFHLEGRSYQEISGMTGVPENSIGPTLSRARQRLRQFVDTP